MINDAVAFDVAGTDPSKMIDDAYDCTGGFRDGSYLVKHPLENHFDERRKFSYYVNFFYTIIDAMVRKVFDNKIVRETQNEKLLSFWDNCDNRGTTISEWMQQRAATEVRKHSSYFVIMDNFPAELQPATEKEAIDNRILPYIYGKKRQDLRGYKLDRYNRLQQITFYNGEHTIVSGKGEKKEYVKCLEISKDIIREYYIIPKTTTAEEQQVDLRVDEINMPMIPVKMIVDNVPKDNELLPMQKTYGLMRICHALYNKDSEMREIERAQEFSILVIFTDDPDNLSTGTGKALALPTLNATMPAFISPNPALLDGLSVMREKLRDDLYRVAEQNGVIGVQSAKSGVALGIEFEPLASKLSETANICESLENWMVKCFSAWVREPIEASVHYVKDYSVQDETAKRAWVDMALTYDVTPETKALAESIVFSQMSGDDKHETSEDILDAVRTADDNRKKDEASMVDEDGDTV